METGRLSDERPGSRGRIRFGIAGALLASLLVALPAHAGRPLDTEDTGTVEPGRFELEVGADWARNVDDQAAALKGVLSAGLLPRLELRVESQALVVDPDGERANAGAGDTVLGVKYRILDEAGRLPAVLIGGVVRVPTGDEERGLGDEDVDAGIVLALSKSWGPLTLTWNGGYAFVTRGRSLEDWTLSAAAEYRLSPSWAVVAEALGTVSTDGGTDRALVRAGAVHALTERLRLDGAVGVGFTRDSPEVVVTLGFTFGF
jgi:hypothetical protein